jgi:hypothetical protein
MGWERKKAKMRTLRVLTKGILGVRNCVRIWGAAEEVVEDRSSEGENGEGEL